MTHSPAGHPAGSTVLLMDDEEGVRSYCRRVLEFEGAHVVEAADAVGAGAISMHHALMCPAAVSAQERLGF